MGLLARFALTLAAAAAVRADAPASCPNIRGVTFSGNGCPNNAASAGDYNDRLTFSFNRFTAVSPGQNKTVNCEAHINAVGGTPYWQVAVQSIDIKGHLVLEAGAKLDYYTQVFFSQNAANTGDYQGSVSAGNSKIDSTVVLHETFSGSNLKYSPCIGSDGNPSILNIDFRPALDSDSRGTFDVYSEDVSFTWRRCII